MRKLVGKLFNCLKKLFTFCCPCYIETYIIEVDEPLFQTEEKHTSTVKMCDQNFSVGVMSEYLETDLTPKEKRKKLKMKASSSLKDAHLFVDMFADYNNAYTFFGKAKTSYRDLNRMRGDEKYKENIEEIEEKQNVCKLFSEKMN